MTDDEQNRIDRARDFLTLAGVFYHWDPVEDADEPEMRQTLNMNDTWVWASAWGEQVADNDLPEVARLVREYGYPGALYWVSEKHDKMRSEFQDINRFVDFVRHEERIKAEEPSSNKRAYRKVTYTLGA